jgi:hypothetical protein
VSRARCCCRRSAPAAPLQHCTAAALHRCSTRRAPALHPLCTRAAPALHLSCTRSTPPRAGSRGRAAAHRARARAPRAHSCAGCRRDRRRDPSTQPFGRRRAAAARARVRAVRLTRSDVRPRIRCLLPRAPCAARYLRAPRLPAAADTADAGCRQRRTLHRPARPAAEPAVDHGLARGGEPCMREASGEVCSRLQSPAPHTCRRERPRRASWRMCAPISREFVEAYRVPYVYVL